MSNLDDRTIQLSTLVNGENIFRRQITRADGRRVYLYGYQPNTHSIEPQEPDPIAKGGELRWHPLRQEWNIFAAHRQNRTFKPVAADNPLAPTPPGGPATEIPVADFELAIFENKFTSLHFDAPTPPPGTTPDLPVLPAHGQCEVIVYGPSAEGSLASIGQEKRRLLIAAWIDRYEALFAKGCEYILPFENRGEDVGVTLPHPHGQIYGFDRVPPVQARAADAFAKGYDLARDLKHWRDTHCIASAGGIDAVCPPFARFPFEVWITPRTLRAGPWDLTDEETDGFAHLLGDITRRYDKYFDQETPYMLALHAAPKTSRENFHFTAQFYPLLRAPGRLKYLASVEQHTGTFTVDVMPDAAANTLKDL